MLFLYWFLNGLKLFWAYRHDGTLKTTSYKFSYEFSSVAITSNKYKRDFAKQVQVQVEVQVQIEDL